ncbi:MAG: PASTA domain-containing protein [Gemmatimonadetes bacterium]|nr:PASTA domain-containing protein [Gemmatimonadota bacterium]
MRTRRARILRIALAALLPFILGYILAVTVLFPPPDVGAAGIAVPSLIGMSTEEARSALAGADLGTLDITALPHPSVPEGTVTAQSPLAGQQLAAGQPVRVSVSSGAPQVVVPDVIGFPIERAASLLTRLGFQIRRADETANAEAGRVLRLDPAPGSERVIPSSITIVVSAGPPRTDVFIDTLGAAAGPPRR